MKALTWHGTRDVSVDEVPDPVIQEPTDAVIRVTSTAICGSDLHLYELLSPFLDDGDILGHEAMGIVEEVGAEVTGVKPGDRVVVPFNIACGRCFMCDRQLYSQCETTQNREHGTGGSLFGYTRLYGSVPGGQAERLRVPHASFSTILVPPDLPDERLLFLSDVLPTSWQAVEVAAIPQGGTVAVLGLGPIGQMCARIARHRGARVLAVDLVPERLEMARRNGIEVVGSRSPGEDAAAIRDWADGRGPDSVIDAVGMEAHGSGTMEFMQKAVGLLPDGVQEPLMLHAGLDRMAALQTAIEAVRRGGTLSIIGVYAGSLDPMPMMKLFDKQVQIGMGQANVKRWIDDLMPLVSDKSDPLGLDDFITHRLPLEDAPHGYEIFQKKEDGAIKIVLQP